MPPDWFARLPKLRARALRAGWLNGRRFTLRRNVAWRAAKRFAREKRKGKG